MSEKIINTKPVTILTGFLGSGKTTYLNHLITKNPDTKYAIIENEFGKESIDSDLILRAEGEVIELNNGCLCCTLNDNLYDILNDLFDRRDEFDKIIIEATGVADPRGLAEPFITHPAIKEQFPLQGVICLIDAELIEDHIHETEEAIQQITFSDILLINKTDLVNDDYIQKLSKKLHQLNPVATILNGYQNDFPDIDLLKKQRDFDEQLANAEEHLNFPIQKEHSHNHQHTKSMVSFTIKIDRPFDLMTLQHRLMVYLTFQAKDLYRMKGFLWLNGSDEQHLLQAVGKRFNIEAKRAWGQGESQQSKIIFIGKNLKKEGLIKMLEQCVAKDFSPVTK